MNEQITPLSEKMKKWVQPIDKETRDVKQALKNFCEELDNILEKKTGKYSERDQLSKTLFTDTIFYRKDLIMKEIDELLIKHFGKGLIE